MAELKYYTQEFMISKTDQRDDSKYYVSDYYYHSQTLSKSVFNDPILNLDNYGQSQNQHNT